MVCCVTILLSSILSFVRSCFVLFSFTFIYGMYRTRWCICGVHTNQAMLVHTVKMPVSIPLSDRVAFGWTLIYRIDNISEVHYSCNLTDTLNHLSHWPIVGILFGLFFLSRLNLPIMPMRCDTMFSCSGGLMNRQNEHRRFRLNYS